jgi:RNA polymerase sigma factor (sigma-70 family)
MPNTFSFEEAVSSTPFQFGDRSRKPKVPVVDGADDTQIDIDPDGIQSQYKSIADELGFRQTSTVRPVMPGVGAGSRSQHPKGTASDFSVRDKKPEQIDALINRLRSEGFEVIDERDGKTGTGPHIHAEIPPGGRKSSGSGEGGSNGAEAVAPPMSKTFSYDDAVGVPTASTAKPTTEKSFLQEQFAPDEDTPYGSIIPKFIRKPLSDAIEGGWEKFSNRLMTDLGQIQPDDPRYSPRRQVRINAQGDREFVVDDPFGEGRRIQAGKDKPVKENVPGFMANIENPVELFLNDSLPANATEALFRATDDQRQSIMDARKVSMQENIVANPDKFPAVSVQAAKQAIAARDAKRDPTVGDMWRDLKQAATEDPGKFGAQLVNAIMADPEMLLAPQGIGLRVASGTRALKTASAASKVTRIADNVIDAGSTGAALNLGIDLASSASEGRGLTSSEALMSGVSGAVLSAPFGVLMGKGRIARDSIAKGTLNEADLDAALRDAAKEELATEDLIRSSEIDRTVKHRIEDATGIKFESNTDLKAYLETQRKEWKKLFSDRDLNGQYQSALADERMIRREQLSKEAIERGERQVAEAEQAQRIAAEQDRARVQAERRARFAQEYEEALAARDRNAADADAEDRLFNVTRRLDEQEIFESALEEDIPQVRNAMRKAVARDNKLRVPKWQRGEADPRLVARLGLAGTFGTLGYMFADEGNKEATGLAALLTGLVLPGGGDIRIKNLGRRLSQAGVTTVDGDIVSLLIKQGKLKAAQDVPDIMARERQLIDAAKTGDQTAYKQLYKDNFSRIQRMVSKQMKSISGRTGMDAEDLAQEVFLDAFRQLDNFSGDVPFSAYLTKIAKNKVVDAIRDAQSLKGGRDTITASMYAPAKDVGESARSGQIVEADNSAIKPDVEAAASDMDTPENQMIRADAERIITNTIEKLSEAQQKAFILHNIEQFSHAEIAKMTDQNLSTVLMQVKTANDKVAEALAKGFNATKIKNVDIPVTVKRGRGLPRKDQTGEIDQRMLQVMGVVGLGAGAGFFLNDQNRLLGAGIGAGLAGLLMSRGVKGRTLGSAIIETADYTLGVTSTRIMNKSKPLWRKAIEHERTVLRDTHKYMKAVDPFLVSLESLPPETRNILSRAILTGKPEVVNKLLQAIGDESLIKDWKTVRSTLDSIGDQLISLRRFKSQTLDYFPRIVKDVEGLVKALGKERGSLVERALKDADNKAIKARGTGLTELEQSLVINKIMQAEARASQQPGFAKNRVVEEITPELQQFYATPTESLHSYIRSAVEDIQKAKFFGGDLKVVKKGEAEYTNVDTSVGALVNRLMNEGKLSPTEVEGVSKLLKSRFMTGERAPGEIIQLSKNLSYAGLLGNPFSAMTQLGDVIIQAYTQDMRATMEAVVRVIGKRKYVDMKDFGLSDHIAEEFASTSKSAKALNQIFKWSLFKGVDEFGKDVALNAAVSRFGRLAKTDEGVNVIAQRYGEALMPEEFNQLLKDLRKGEVTDLVRSIAFAELSRTQPISRLELPQAYLDNPNGRVLYQFKTFMLKQIDLARRDGYDEIKKGNTAKGLKNLTELSIALGVAGASTSTLRDFLLNRDIDFKASDIPLNALKTFGMSEYFLDNFFGVSKEEAADARADGDKSARSIKAAPLGTLAGVFTPPFKMFDEIVRGDKKAVRYIPFIGPIVYEQQKAKEVNSEQ